MPGNTASIILKAKSTEIRKGTDDLKKMDRQAGRTEKATKRLGKSFASMGRVAGVAAGAMAAVFTRAVIKNTIEQDHAVAQLNASLKSTGRFTEEASKAMQDHAAALQQVSTFGDEAIITMQSQLLTFVKLGGEVLPRTTQAVLDLSAKMDQGLKESAVQLGKALNDPVANLGALSRVGIQFTDAQTDLIKSLAETNRLSEAQGIILDVLEEQFEGSAAAARKTLGGALKVLSNNFGDLLEVSGDGTSGVTGSINQLADTLAKPEVKEGFQTLAAGALSFLEIVAQLPGAVGFLRDELKQLFGIVDTQDFVRRDEEIAELEEQLVDARESASAWWRTENNIFSARATSLEREIALKKEALEQDRLAAAQKSKKSAQTVESTAAGVAGAVGVLKNETDATNELNEAKKTSLSIQQRFIDFARDAVAARTDQIGRTEEYIEQLEFENSLIGLGNAAREEAIALRRLESDATVDQVNTVKKLIAERHALGTELETAGREAGVTDGQGFDGAGFFSGFVESAARGKDAMRDFVTSAISDLTRLLIQKQLLGSFGGGGGSFGGFFGSLFGSSTGSQVGALLDAPGMFANGGDFSANDPMIVGERGPELIVPRKSGTVIPNDKVGGNVTSITVNLPPQTQRITAQQTADEVSRVQSRAVSRNR